MSERARPKLSEAGRKVLLKLAKANQLTPDNVIAEAKNKSSPFHKQFEWNVDKAAMEQWRDTARWIIAGYKIEIVINQQVFNVSQFVSDVRKAPWEQGYCEVGSLVTREHEA